MPCNCFRNSCGCNSCNGCNRCNSSIIYRSERGATGTTPNITIGTVTTVAPGSSATASITGTTPNLILNLGIPQGATGEAGPAGADGATPTLTIGTVTTGEPGTDASASITGTAPNFVLNLVIPRGDTGNGA